MLIWMKNTPMQTVEEKTKCLQKCARTKVNIYPGEIYEMSLYIYSIGLKY